MRHVPHNLVAILTAAALLDAAAWRAEAAGLDGATVSYSGYCCTSVSPADLVTNSPTAVVGPGVEFPLGSVLTNGRLNVIPFSLDVSSDRIDSTFLSSGVLLTGAFNGGVLTFSGAPVITGVTVDPLSNFVPTGLTFTATSVSTDASGERFSYGMHEILDVTTGAETPAPVPEAPTWAVLGAGLAGLLLIRRRSAPRPG